MNKSKKVRSVYMELKDVFGDEMTSKEILECSALLVESTEDSLYEPVVDLNIGPAPINELPLNVVFEHMGWKLINREIVWEDDYIPHEPSEVLVEQCIDLAA